MKIKLVPLFALVVISLAVLSCKKDATNGRPSITSFTINPVSINANGSATITVIAVDPENDPLSYHYIVSGGAISGNGSSVSWTAPATAGEYSISVTVTDGNGGELTAKGSITVNSASTQITGTASFPAGTYGDLANSKVSIYTSYDNWLNNMPVKFVTAVGSGSTVSFTITDVIAGNYYLDVWKDVDYSNGWSVTDFVGFYMGATQNLAEFQLAEGQTFSCSIEMSVLAKKSASPWLKH